MGVTAEVHRRELPIAEPCDEAWAGMVGDERRRLCRACGVEVVALSALTRAEAAAVLATACAGLCVRYEHDEDGAVRFADTKRPPEKPPVRPRMGRFVPPKPVTPPTPVTTPPAPVKR